MKKYFMTGLIIALPLVLTLMILKMLISIFTAPFIGLVESFIDTTNLEFLGSHYAVFILSQILVLFFIVIILIVIGMIAQFFAVKLFFSTSDRILHRIPFINKIYKTIQDVMNTLFKPEGSNFSQVVLVPFPDKNSWTVGLITNKELAESSIDGHLKMISVFVPGTPNPTLAFMVMYKKEDIIFLDIKVEEAVRFVLSCGVIYEGFVKRSQTNG